MMNVGEHSLAPETVREAMKLAKQAKQIICPVPGGAGGSVKIVKADYLAYLVEMLEGQDDYTFDHYGHTGGVLNTKTGTMCL